MLSDSKALLFGCQVVSSIGVSLNTPTRVSKTVRVYSGITMHSNTGLILKNKGTLVGKKSV